MEVIIACENSGVVRDEFIKKGHNAVSCDLLPSEKPGPHIQDDILNHLNKGWDLMIAHPPCTYLCSSGLHWNGRVEGRHKKTEEALEFVRKLMKADIPRIAIENPVGKIGTSIRPADQYIQPYQFGDDASKKTGLWLKNLPKLKPTKYVNPEYACNCGYRFEYELGKYGCPNCCGDNGAAKQVWANQTNSGQNNVPPGDDQWKIRSKTYEGIAKAMAKQWGRKTNIQIELI